MEKSFKTSNPSGLLEHICVSMTKFTHRYQVTFRREFHPHSHIYIYHAVAFSQDFLEFSNGNAAALSNSSGVNALTLEQDQVGGAG